MANTLENIENIGPGYAQKLAAVGLKTTTDLLEKGGSKKGRKEIADSTGISEDLILKWVNHSDLFRIKGIGDELAELLEAAEVDTVKELRKRNGENLHIILEKMNAVKKLTPQIPSEDALSEMIREAKTLEPRVSY